jgi:hypothetical protein
MNALKLITAMILALVAAPLAAAAQQVGRVWRVGVLAPGSPIPGTLPLQVFDGA